MNEVPGDRIAESGVPALNERQWAAGAHLAALILALVTSWAAGIAGVVGALAVWMIKKDAMPFVDDQGKESLNFQITVTIAAIIAAVLIVFLIGFLLLPAVGLAALVFTVIAGIKANEGVAYRYPFTLRLIK